LTAKNGESADATSGKAERRLFQQFYRFLNGSDIMSHLDMEGLEDASHIEVEIENERPSVGKMQGVKKGSKGNKAKEVTAEIEVKVEELEAEEERPPVEPNFEDRPQLDDDGSEF